MICKNLARTEAEKYECVARSNPQASKPGTYAPDIKLYLEDRIRRQHEFS